MVVSPTISEVLSTHLVKHLHLGALQALRHTSQTMRSCVESAQFEAWLHTSRASLPEDHPVFATKSIPSICLLADQAALLHSRLSTAALPLKVSSLTSHYGNIDRSVNRLQLTASHDGSLFVSEAEGRLHLHELVLDPTPGIQLVASQASPFQLQQPEAGYETRAVWAPDTSALLLRQWTDCDDAAPSTWQVAYLWDMASLAMKPIHLPQGPNPGELESVFSRGSNLIILVSGVFEHDSSLQFDVYRWDCQAVAHFEVAADEWVWPSFAVTDEDMLAVSGWGKIHLWDLLSGGLVRSIRNPQALAPGSGPAPSMLIDRGGRRLAVLPADLHAVYVFDALTLDILGCVPPADHAAPDPQSGLLLWGVGDEQVLTGLYTMAISGLGDECNVQVCRLVPGRAMASEEAWWGGQDFVMSPDGAFMCDFIGAQMARPAASADGSLATLGIIRICDACSGDVVFEHSLGLDQADTGFLCHPAWDIAATGPVRWSSCGMRLVVPMFAWETTTSRGIDRILVLQL